MYCLLDARWFLSSLHLLFLPARHWCHLSAMESWVKQKSSVQADNNQKLNAMLCFPRYTLGIPLDKACRNLSDIPCRWVVAALAPVPSHVQAKPSNHQDCTLRFHCFHLLMKVVSWIIYFALSCVQQTMYAATRYHVKMAYMKLCYLIFIRKVFFPRALKLYTLYQHHWALSSSAFRKV